MRKLVLFFVLAVVMIGIVSAENSLDYQVFDEKVLVEMSFDSVSDFELKLPFDFDALDVSGAYELGDDKIIRISSASDLEISYITRAHVDKSGRKYFFVARNFLSDSVDVRLFLPEGAVLSEGDDYLVVPRVDRLTSDGRRVIFLWNDFSEEQIVVSYEFIEDDSFLFKVLIVLILGYAIYYLVKKSKRKGPPKAKDSVKSKRIRKKRELTRNLFKEERKIVEYLLDKKKNESWTKEIVRDLGISKVRLSRRLRNLEQKELIKKTPYGNENKIKLIKSR